MCVEVLGVCGVCRGIGCCVVCVEVLGVCGVCRGIGSMWCV